MTQNLSAKEIKKIIAEDTLIRSYVDVEPLSDSAYTYCIFLAEDSDNMIQFRVRRESFGCCVELEGRESFTITRDFYVPDNPTEFYKSVKKLGKPRRIDFTKMREGNLNHYYGKLK